MAQWEIREGYDLSIPSLSVRAPVFLPSARYWSTREWEALERQMQVGLLYGVVAYPHSVEPGERGTIIIAGHSSPPTDRAKESRYGEVFARIPDLKLHDQVVLRTASAAFTYEVTATEIVPAGDTTILTQQKGTHLLKLITCYPVGSVKERLIVAAELVGSE
jgi:LPXTG-site transpeptidase (sortase) family protein